ncbi:MAG TPA: histidine phosphatase family protein [Sandaracinaceae bacterium]
MRVVLVRHGEASDPAASADRSRHLTVRGRDVTREVARKLRERGLVPTAMYTSPLVRAVQTAEILAHEFGFVGPVFAHDPLVPDGTTARALSVLDAHGDDDVVFLVTHEPIVRALAGHLSGLGGAFPGFRTSGVAVVDVEGDRGALVARLDPSTMRWRDPSDLRP